MRPKHSFSISLAAGLAAAVSLLPVPRAVAAVAPTEYRVSLPALFTIDALNRTITPTTLSGELQALDGSGSVISTSAVPVAITPAAITTTSAGSSPSPPGCSPSQSSGGNVTVYAPYHVSSPPNDSFELDYVFETIQYDKARTLMGPNGYYDSRQFLQCAAGGGQVLTWKQDENGAGVTMEDPTSSLLASSWGEWRQDSGSSTAFGATINSAPASVTGSTTQPAGGGVYTGSVGNNANTGYLSAYPKNQVNGWWRADSSFFGFDGTGPGAYRGNPSTALWEYPMTDGHSVANIRAQTWLEFTSGPTFYQAAPRLTMPAPVNFSGEFQVVGNLPGGTTVYSRGNDGFPPNPTNGRTQTIFGACCAKAWHTTSGTVTVTVAPDRNNAANRLPAGSYSIGFRGGPTYGSHGSSWTLTCGGAGTTVLAAGVMVGSNGTLGPFTYSVPWGQVANTATQESSVCISDSQGVYGNQVPVTLV